MKFTALYVRTSTEKQDTGLEAQLRALKKYCTDKGIENYKVYSDAGISGAKRKRPGLDELMEDVREERISVLMVYSFSRVARSVKHLIDILDELHERDVDFISLSESVNTTTPLGKMTFVIISALSEFERSMIVSRVKTGLENARAKGVKLGRPQTRNEPLIRSLREKGMTYDQISELTGFSTATISRVLNNKFQK